MNISETLRGLARRWYIVVPGVILAVVLAFGTWTMVQPDYERTATQVLLPGTGTLPEGATNPYLYLGGLTAPADVLVRAVGSEDGLRDILAASPGAVVEVTRDPSAAGPVILIKVTARSDAEADSLIRSVVERTAETLADLQTEESIKGADRITVQPISIDDQSTIQQRNRIVFSGGIALGVVVATIVIASVVDGLAIRARRSRRGEDADEGEGSSGSQTGPFDDEEPAGPDTPPEQAVDIASVPVIDLPSRRGTSNASARVTSSVPE